MKRLSQIIFFSLVSCSPETGPEKPAEGSAAVVPKPVEKLPAASAPVAQSSPTYEEKVAPAPPSSDQPKLAVEGDGLRWFLPPYGSARALPFGAPKDDVLASLEGVRGPANKGTNEDCGAGPVQYASWPDGLSIVFQKGRFVGWGLDRRASGALATANGIGPGTSRRELAGSSGSLNVRQSSLGTEFVAGAVFGVLDGSEPQAVITDMWAGVSCVARRGTAGTHSVPLEARSASARRSP